METNRRVQKLLQECESALGQCINIDKTTMMFSKNITPATQTEIMAIWTNDTLKQYEKYLGLPPIVGRAKRKALLNIKQSVWSKLQTWKEKSLSLGEKEILLKVVALVIPTYAMSCFKLPTNLCVKLERRMSKFWWR